MATGYYYAAHFNMPNVRAATQIEHDAVPSYQSHAMDTQTKQTKESYVSPNVFMTAAQHQYLPGYTSQQEDSTFFRLPAELRNQIYNELLCPAAPKSKTLAQHQNHTHKQENVYPAILSTCRKIQEEAADLLYTRNVFHAHPSLLTSLPHLTPDAKPVIDRSAISKIKRWQLTVRLDIDARFTVQQATAAFSGAEYLELHVWQAQFDGCNAAVLKLFTGIRGVKIAKVSGIADSQLARWLEHQMMQPTEQNCGEFCHCEHEWREVRCGTCCKKVDLGAEMLVARDAWTFGNR